MLLSVLPLALVLSGAQSSQLDFSRQPETPPPSVITAQRPTVQPRRSIQIRPEIAHLGLGTYARVSSEIVHARVLGSRVAIEPGMPILTVWRLEVLGAVKGWSRGQVDVALAGGESDDVTVTLLHAPRFVVGEEVVVFLSQGENSAYPTVLGLDQGAYSVVRDEHGLRRVSGLHASAAPLAEFLGEVGELAYPVHQTPR